jgi:hypothetical protein
MVGVVGHTSKQDASTVDESKVATWATQVVAGYFVLPPLLGDDFGCECICPQGPVDCQAR